MIPCSELWHNKYDTLFLGRTHNYDGLCKWWCFVHSSVAHSSQQQKYFHYNFFNTNLWKKMEGISSEWTFLIELLSLLDTILVKENCYNSKIVW